MLRCKKCLNCGWGTVTVTPKATESIAASAGFVYHVTVAYTLAQT
ncbi:MAG: hypothetical protein NT137_06780 [Methanomassiliicoccales archaeon]|nr:hypothetical protein [Methanomassiliicoccales archaeon]